MSDYYIYASSSTKVNGINNSFLDFSVKIPSTVNLNEGEWEIGLAEISYGVKKRKYPSMLLCCDKIKHSFFDGKTVGVLRLLMSCINGIDKTYDEVYYFDLLSYGISYIRLYIKVMDSGNYSFSNDTLYCTLHLRQKK